MVNSKSKGGSYERQVSEKLSLWWSEGEDKNIFYRSQSSGSRGKMNENVVNSYADICASKFEGYPLIQLFVIECKKGYSNKKSKKCNCREKWDVLTVLDSDNKNITVMNFLDEIYEDAELASENFNYEIKPVIIARRTGRKDVIILPKSICLELHAYNDLLNQLTHMALNNLLEFDDTYIFRLDDFFELVEPDTIKEIVKDKNA